jgi:type III pantothenate kinase
LILCAGIGNTNIRCAVGTIDQYRQFSVPITGILHDADFIKIIEERFGTDIWGSIHGSIISSVVPLKTSIIKEAIYKKTGKYPEFIDKHKCNVDFSGYKSELGEDRIVCVAAAARKYKLPAIIMDLGTATTINIISIDKKFLGGAIFPGIQTGLNALAQHAALLPEVTDFSDVRVIGGDTLGCLVSGAVIGIVCVIEGYVKRIRPELGSTPTIIITGGNAPKILPYCDFKFVYEPALLIEEMFMF